MIDAPHEAANLVAKLKRALPLQAVISPQSAVLLHDRAPELSTLRRCRVTQIHYGGDEGGIMCMLDPGGDASKNIFVVSITHLIFGIRQPLGREIAAYQKQRIKRIRREARRAA